MTGFAFYVIRVWERHQSSHVCMVEFPTVTEGVCELVCPDEGKKEG